MTGAGHVEVFLPAPQGPGTVVCFGELLWDNLPQGRFVGGAPGNVAYHLKQLGFAPHVLSAVGDDAAGAALLGQLAEWQLDLSGIARRPGQMTGEVHARVGADGDAVFEIVEGVAWDLIELPRASAAVLADAQALVFGSLAQRSLVNRTTLDRVLAALPDSAERVFDVNLRPPFDDVGRVRELARLSTLVKLNAEEAARLVGEPFVEGAEERHARFLAREFSCCSVCITSGARGAGWLDFGQWYWEPGQPVVVADTVGAGDAFLAALIAARLRREGPAMALRQACRLGEWVASQRGATPRHPSSLRTAERMSPR